jgi:hypothetical protein
MSHARGLARESDMRPFIQVPTWDGKIVLATIFTMAYFGLAVYIIKFGGLSGNQKDLALVVLAATGPNLTQIFTALFRTTAAEERNNALRSADLQAAITAPPMAPAMTGPQSTDISDAVERGTSAGLSGAEPVKVEVQPSGSPAPLAADGERRDWLDEPIPSSPPNVGGTPVMGD